MYYEDRCFTDNVHKKLALSYIYPKMGWKVKSIDDELAEIGDVCCGVDYHAIDKQGRDILIQERFRRPQKFNDITFRYERPDHPEEVEQKSEFFKIKARILHINKPFYMVYGYLDNSGEEFSKLAVLDLRAFFEHYRKKEIQIKYIPLKKTKVENGILYGGINSNFDGSSSFLCFDVGMLVSTFNDVVIHHEGFVVK